MSLQQFSPIAFDWTEPELRVTKPDESTSSNSDKSRGELFIDDVIVNEDFFGGISARRVMRKLDEMKDAKVIDVWINSPGGSYFAAVSIYNALVRHKAEIIVHVDGLAASAASVIAMAGDKRFMAATAMMMIHEASAIVMGFAKDLRRRADMLDKLGVNIQKLYADRSGGNAEDFGKLMVEETWFNAEEAKNKGLADEITPNKTKTDKGAKNHADAVVAFGFRKPERYLELVNSGAMNMTDASNQAPVVTNPTNDTTKATNQETAPKAEGGTAPAAAAATDVKPPVATPAAPPAGQPANQGGEDPVLAERKRCREITALCDRSQLSNAKDLARQFIDNAVPVDQVKAQIGEMLINQRKPVGDEAASSDPSGKSTPNDPKAGWKQEYASNRETFQGFGVSEESYLNTKAIDANGGVLGIEPQTTQYGPV